MKGRSRKSNSDAFAVATGGTCQAFAVADGVGALEASPRASDAAARAAASWVVDQETLSAEDASAFVAAVDGAVRDAIRDDRGGTTLACALLSPAAEFVLTVGDSEALAIGVDGPAQRLTPVDHVPRQPNMLLAWIDGKVEVQPHVAFLAPMPHRVVLATDGVTGVLDSASIADIVRSVPVAMAAEKLVEAAQAEGTADDASAIVIAAPTSGESR